MTPPDQNDVSNVPTHPIRQRLVRIPTASPDLLAIIKQEGRA